MSPVVSAAFSPDAAGALPGPDWLVARRCAAADRFATTPLPSPEEEVWRNSRIGDLDLAEHTPIPAGRPDFDDDEFVQMAAGAALGDASDALTMLHDAFCEPVEIDVPEGSSIAQVVVIHQFRRSGAASFPRLVVGRDASIRHASVQVLGSSSWQIARLAFTVAQGGTIRAGTAAFGGDYSRLRVDTELSGRGAHGDLVAGYFGSGTQLLDFRTFQDHAVPDTTSNLLFKGALDSRAVVCPPIGPSA